jgi:hypothetical protein
MSPTSYTVDMININHASLNILAPIFSSLAGALKRLRWIQTNTTQETWRNLYILTNLLPNLMDLNLSTFRGGLTLPPALPRIHCRLTVNPLTPPLLNISSSKNSRSRTPFLRHRRFSSTVKLTFKFLVSGAEIWNLATSPVSVERKARIKYSDQFHRRFQKPSDVVRGVPCPPGGQLLLPVIHRTDLGLDSQQLPFPHTSILSGGCSRYNLQHVVGVIPSKPSN